MEIKQRSDFATHEEWARWKMCGAKKPFTKKKLARQHNKKCGHPTNYTYKCPICEQWHTTKTKINPMEKFEIKGEEK